MTPRRLRIIGLGNALRGDDAVGLVVARRVRELLPGADVLELSGEPAELLDALGDGVEHVVLVDAVTSGAPPGTVHRLDASEAALAVDASSALTHGLGLAETIELGRALGRLPRAAARPGRRGTELRARCAALARCRAGCRRPGRRAVWPLRSGG